MNIELLVPPETPSLLGTSARVVKFGSLTVKKEQKDHKRAMSGKVVTTSLEPGIPYES